MGDSELRRGCTGCTGFTGCACVKDDTGVAWTADCIGRTGFTEDTGGTDATICDTGATDCTGGVGIGDDICTGGTVTR